MNRPQNHPNAIVVAGALLLAAIWQPLSAQANDFELDPENAAYGNLGVGLQNRPTTWFDVHGNFRSRGEGLYNLDLDRGLSPLGQAVFPVPLSDPRAQWLTHADMRLRTDVTAHAPGGQVAVHMRLDMLDNIAFGSLSHSESGSGGSVANLRRAWAETLVPFGVLAAGRMGSHWGLGMLANGGDCADCNTSEAADRIALVSPLLGHIFALSYDLSGVGPQSARPDPSRSIDVDPRDDVRALNFAVLQWHSRDAIARRNSAGLSTLDYGAFGSYRWQDTAVAVTAQAAQPSQAIARHLRAAAGDFWLRYVSSKLRVEVEAAAIWSRVDQPSLLPGVLYRDNVQAQQYGIALQQEWGERREGLTLGLDLGAASGDAAPGVSPYAQQILPVGKPGDVRGGQLDVPRDPRADDFHFQPDYRVDQILFHNLVGTVTDAAYLRPHLRYRIAEFGAGRLDLKLAGVLATALFAESTPGQVRPLGVEIDPGLDYLSNDGFGFSLHGGFFLPGSGFDNPAKGLTAHWASLVQSRIHYRF